MLLTTAADLLKEPQNLLTGEAENKTWKTGETINQTNKQKPQKVQSNKTLKQSKSPHLKPTKPKNHPISLIQMTHISSINSKHKFDEPESEIMAKKIFRYEVSIKNR